MAAPRRRSGRKPRPHPPEFRQRALDLVRSCRPVPEVAKLLGIAESSLYRWKRQDLVDRGLDSGTSRAESAELVAARQKIRDLEEENKILRKAAAAVREVVPPKERYRLVAELHADGVRSARPAARWTCRPAAQPASRQPATRSPFWTPMAPPGPKTGINGTWQQEAGNVTEYVVSCARMQLG